MIYAQPNICPGEWHTQTSLGFWYTNGSPNLGQMTKPYHNQQKKRTFKIVEFTVPADNRVKLKENEKWNKYLDLAWELKKLWNMRVMLLLIIICAFGTVTKGLIKGLEDFGKKDEWRQSKLLHYWDRPEYWEESWRLAVSQTPADVKNPQRVTEGVSSWCNG